ncbi:class I glutamine amidotransferase-like protein [Fomes fomentarius]|nr:class I glutamine amidotransferase-like protein [Fomes fomentarius]
MSATASHGLEQQQQQNEARVLIYTATRGFHHQSTPDAVDALRRAAVGPLTTTATATTRRITFEHTDDQTWFTDERLAGYDAVLFLNSMGEVLDEPGQAALKRYLDLGGNFVGVHAASCAMPDTEWFRHEIGATFDYHPAICTANINVVGPPHPSIAGLPKVWQVYDEMYNFKSDPRLGAVLVLSVDESSYEDPGERKFDHGQPHPIAWFQEHGAGSDAGSAAGRSFYTSLGHTSEIWQDPLFVRHVMGGVEWALLSGTTRAFNPEGKVGNGPGSGSAAITS